MASKVVLITGASSGIGRAAAKLFADRGDRVVLAARRADRLEKLAGEIAGAGGEAMVAAVDLDAWREAAPALIDKILDAYGRLDILVNNAGFGIQCEFETMTDEVLDELFRVNVLSAMALARGVVDIMRRQGAGSIINVASAGGVVANPLNVAYCATKHALVGFSKGLRLELMGTGIGVTAVCPGATRTEFFDAARPGVPYDGSLEPFMVRPERVGRAIVKASTKNRAIVFPSWDGRVMAFIEKVFPWLNATGNIIYRNRALKQARLSR